MRKNSPVAATVEAYIEGFPAPTQKLLKQMRKTIRAAAPKAEESISYMMPAYKHAGPLVYFGGYAKHIGFYPGAVGVEAFVKEIKNYQFSKGTIQFPLDKPLPLDLITEIVKFRVKQNEEKAAAKKAKPKTKK